MASHQNIHTHTMQWAYLTNSSTIRGVFLELMNDMTFVDADWTTLMDVSKFGATLIGTPSLQIDSGGHYEMAVTILDYGDLFPYLIYMNYVGGSNTSCINSGSPYQCDVIDTPGFWFHDRISFDNAEDGTVGIVCYKSGELMAYLHTPSPGWLSNCGQVAIPGAVSQSLQPTDGHCG
jgi:hypothetical protein